MAQAGTAGRAAAGHAARRCLCRAALSFIENGPIHAGQHRLDPDWMVTHVGDVVLSRRDMGTSYHLSVVLDDAAQGITEVTRGS